MFPTSTLTYHTHPFRQVLIENQLQTPQPYYSRYLYPLLKLLQGERDLNGPKGFCKNLSWVFLISILDLYETQYGLKLVSVVLNRLVGGLKLVSIGRVSIWLVRVLHLLARGLKLVSVRGLVLVSQWSYTG